ncbi:E3 ubiquitin-protein ligase TRIM39-like [Hemiscyllium ocellatum]|uniref:E3 ubiquitin-protein ligase TRIM39-like n=1 Tax=Hemiscyllium ocellatum TaxID=170820 RepID=UPI002966F61A|nr:E3 ubiquitin-protein ligase TRIM39-like [Hemiscyllium ocellatum]
MGTAKELGDLTHELTCPICLEIFTDPVSLDCEHHYCRSCISQSWEKVTGDVSCPECRQVFSQKNIRPARTLSSIVEKFRKLKAKVTERQNGPYCQEHEKKLKLFCEEEEEIICVDCWSSAHETHDVTTLKEASRKYKEAFQACLDLLDWEIKDMIENKEKQEAKMEELKAQADQLMDTIQKEFEKMHNFLNEQEETMRTKLRQEEDNMLKRLEEYIGALNDGVLINEQLISELQARLKITEAAEFLKDVKGTLTRCENRAKLPEENDVEMTMEIFGEPFQFFRVWKGMRRIIEPVPESLTLDPNTANDQLIISEDLRSVEHSNAERGEEEDLPDTPERFDEYLYVLSSQGFTSGIHYWEVDLRNKVQWVVGVCGESSRRKGAFLPLTTEGYWVMSLFNENDYRASTVESTTISVEVKPWKLGVYLDYEGGELVFYNADNMSHLYTFSDTFIEKLFPIFSPCNNLTGKNGESLTLLTG